MRVRLDHCHRDDQTHEHHDEQRDPKKQALGALIARGSGIGRLLIRHAPILHERDAMGNVRRTEPRRPHAPVTCQWVLSGSRLRSSARIEQVTSNDEVAGSNPAGGANLELTEVVYIWGLS